MRSGVAEVVPALIACVGLPAYLGATGASGPLFATYVCVAAFALTVGEGLTGMFSVGDAKLLAVKLGFWVGATAALGSIPYVFGRVAFTYASRKL